MEDAELGLRTRSTGHLDLRLEKNLGWTEGSQGGAHGGISGGASNGKKLLTVAKFWS